MSSNFKNLYTSNNPPLQATLMRGSNIESIHKIHAVITDKKGRVLMCAGNPEYKSFIRSALKPFQAIPFVSSGAASKINNESKSIALACGLTVDQSFIQGKPSKFYGNMTLILII